MKMPLGIKLLLIFATLFTAWSIVEVLQGKYLAASTYGLQVPDSIEVVITLGFLVADIAWIAGMLKRLSWSWKLFLGLSLVEVAFFIVGKSQTGTSASPGEIVFLGLIILVCFYVYKKRDYFNRK